MPPDVELAAAPGAGTCMALAGAHIAREATPAATEAVAKRVNEMLFMWVPSWGCWCPMRTTLLAEVRPLHAEEPLRSPS